MKTRIIYCCECKGPVNARLATGLEIYPHRPDLYPLPLWICDSCNNYVGCHHKTADRERPLGCIPNDEMRNARQHIHALIDPVWKSGKISRSRLYKELSKRIGGNYHTASIRTIDEARRVYKIAKQYIKTL